MRRRILYLTIALGVGAFAASAHAQEQNYLSRPVRILSAAAPGAILTSWCVCCRSEPFEAINSLGKRCISSM